MPNPIQVRRARLMAFAPPQAAMPARSNPRLEIASLRDYRLREPVSGRSYTVLRLETRGGLEGYGECPEISARDLAGVLDAVRGTEATQFETLRHRLKNAPYGLMAALNMAMLDVVGRSAQAPVYQVLGGPTRNKCRALAPLEGAADSDLAESARRARAAGFQAFLVPAPAPAARNQGQAFVLAARKRLDTLRQAAGAGTDFVLDCAANLVPGDAASLAAAFERYHLLWLEEPCPPLNLGALKKIATENVTPLGLGRSIQQPSGFQDLLREEAIDILRPDISLTGISQIRQMAAIAESYYVAVAPYHNGGPVASAAALQLAASLPNFFIQQIPFPQAEQDRKMRAAVAGDVETVKDGFAVLPSAPGLGITVNEKALEEYKERTA
ncbi:MAG TPA: mandelate racemase/muconate lactonizing enzyme family protein [Candidatus Acidoferrales bacterium]|nr:mandelate racemase/muconate lactonizing enzyme family protein [Candidatus Acidoferrales bacterium]